MPVEIQNVWSLPSEMRDGVCEAAARVSFVMTQPACAAAPTTTPTPQLRIGKLGVS